MGLMVMASPPSKILVSGDGEADAFEDIDDYLAQFMQEEDWACDLWSVRDGFNRD